MTKVDHRALADNVRRERTEAGLTQEQLADAAHVAHRQVQRIEADVVDARVGSVAKLADALGLSIVDLVKGVKVVVDADEDSNHIAEPGGAS